MNTFKKLKFLSIGIIVIIIFSTSIVLGTSIIKNAYFNTDLKLTINNKMTENINIVTVEIEGEKYGRNYYSIADIVKALNDYGNVNATVSFNPETKTTNIDIQNVLDIVSQPDTKSLMQEITPYVTPTSETTQINEKGDESTMDENTNLITQNPLRNQEPYSSVDKLLIENSTYNDFDVIKYNNNYFIIEDNAKTFFKKDFKYSLSKGTIRLANIDTYGRSIIEENIGYIIIDYVIYFNVNLKI